ncbi:MAG: hypothetical protein HZA93_02420 [Verrucomicrobia bacterium]|nr:hypothetical protein [Verrucomicrobiota bacterium]
MHDDLEIFRDVVVQRGVEVRVAQHLLIEEAGVHEAGEAGHDSGTVVAGGAGGERPLLIHRDEVVDARVHEAHARHRDRRNLAAEIVGERRNRDRGEDEIVVETVRAGVAVGVEVQGEVAGGEPAARVEHRKLVLKVADQAVGGGGGVEERGAPDGRGAAGEYDARARLARGHRPRGDELHRVLDVAPLVGIVADVELEILRGLPLHHGVEALGLELAVGGVVGVAGGGERGPPAGRDEGVGRRIADADGILAPRRGDVAEREEHADPTVAGLGGGVGEDVEVLFQLVGQGRVGGTHGDAAAGAGAVGKFEWLAQAHIDEAAVDLGPDGGLVDIHAVSAEGIYE